MTRDGIGSTGAGPDLPALEVALGYGFRDRELLLRALTHRSFAHEEAEPCRDNEALEFLGDSILAFDVADRLYHLFPGLDEGRLSKHKHLLVRSSTLAAAARRLDLGRHVRLGRGERRAGAGNERILSNVLEAVIAAVYLDGGIGAAHAFIGLALADVLESLDAAHPASDAKSTLQEFAQARGLGTPEYRVIEEAGPDHEKWFRVIVLVGGDEFAEGTGGTKRAAQQVAARQALERIGGA